MYPPAGWTTVTAVLERRDVTGVDDYGNDILGTVEVSLPGCITWPRELAQENGNQVISGLWLVAPLTTLINPDDAIRIGSKTYEVEGEPGEFAPPFKAADLQQVALSKVSG